MADNICWEASERTLLEGGARLWGCWGRGGLLDIHAPTFMDGGGFVCGAVELKPRVPGPDCPYWASQRKLRRLGVRLGSLIRRRFGTVVILGGSEPNTSVHASSTSTPDRLLRPCSRCMGGVRSICVDPDVSETAPAAGGLSGSGVHALITPMVVGRAEEW